MGQALLIFNPARPHSPMFSAQEKKKIPPLLCYQENLSSTSPCNNPSFPILIINSIIEMPKAPCGCYHFPGALIQEFSRCFKMPAWSLQHIC